MNTTGRQATATFALAALAIAAGGCLAQRTARPTLFQKLPEHCNTPDGMTLAPNGDIILACPNFNDKRYPAILARIDKSNKLSVYCPMPVHPDTGRGGPMGLDFGPDGNLYVADNQYFEDTDYKSRLIRINVTNGEPVSADVVVEGFKLANAVIWRGNNVYVSDTLFDLPDKPGASGIYRLSLEEMNNGVVKLKPNATDSHLIAQFITGPSVRDDIAGADGLTFDSKGNLYVGNFGDGVISKITFNIDGSVASSRVLIRDRRVPCADGMFCDLATDTIYLADSHNNAVHAFTPMGKLRTVWQNDDTDGSDGLLDQPCEVLLRGNELIVSCMDFPVPGIRNTAYDEHHTLSVIKLGR